MALTPNPSLIAKGNLFPATAHSSHRPPSRTNLRDGERNRHRFPSRLNLHNKARDAAHSRRLCPNRDRIPSRHLAGVIRLRHPNRISSHSRSARLPPRRAMSKS